MHKPLMSLHRKQEPCVNTDICRQEIVTWKGELYFVDEPSAGPAQLNGSYITFSKNGQMQGIAYRYLLLPLYIHVPRMKCS